MTIGFLATNDEDVHGALGIEGFVLGSAVLSILLLTLAVVLLTQVR
jgi:hypothetical protein